MRSRARDPSVPRPPIHPRDRSRPRPRRGAAVRRHLGRGARAAAGAASRERRPPGPAADEPGDEPDERYRRAARTLAAWRSDGTLHRDPQPSLYVYEQTYRVPGHGRRPDPAGVLRAAAARGVRAGVGRAPARADARRPREDRYRLLRATGVNTSPVIVLYDDAGSAGRPVLDAITAGAPTVDIVDEDGVRHRLWAVAADGDAAARSGAADRGRRGRAGRHRRRPPPLRDRAPLPRRAPDAPVVRGGPGLGLHPDAVPGRGRGAAHGPADPSDRARPRRRGRRAAARAARRAVRCPARRRARRARRAVRGGGAGAAAATGGSGCGRGTAARS